MLESKSDCLMLVLGEQYPTTNSAMQPKFSVRKYNLVGLI